MCICVCLCSPEMGRKEYESIQKFSEEACRCFWSKMSILILKENKNKILFCLFWWGFTSPSTQFRSFRRRSVTLTTLFLDKLPSRSPVLSAQIYVRPSFRVRLTVRETRVVRKVPVGTARGIRKSTVRSDSVYIYSARRMATAVWLVLFHTCLKTMAEY